MFELSVARKYLIPKKKQLSVSLISVMSVAVISLVVWLVLVFLSVTEGIEKSWLHKLTALNAPIRITPTDAYYSSYYYQVDGVSSASNYSHKTIGEKALSSLSDPYSPHQDMEIPAGWQPPDRLSDHSLKDPVKEAFHILGSLKKKEPTLAFQDFELSGALMRLELIRPQAEARNFVTQVSYLASFSDQSPYLHSLILEPSASDLNHLLFLASSKSLRAVLDHATIREVRSPKNYWKLPSSLLPEGSSLRASLFFKQGKISHAVIAPDGEGRLEKTSQGSLVFIAPDKKRLELSTEIALVIQGGIRFHAELVPESLDQAQRLEQVRLRVKTSLQGVPLSGEIFWKDLEIARAEVKTQFAQTPSFSPPWVHAVQQMSVLPVGKERARGVLLAKPMQDTGVKIGDAGYLSYQAATASSVQEQRLPIYVAGFYDPGIMAVGNRCIFVPPSIAHTINASSNSYAFDPTLSNGILVWIKDLKRTDEIKQHLLQAFQAAGIAAYWKVSTFREYDFAKDLLQQFQSDKYLFTLLAGIILVVACCNIISLLVLLVNDKKREIGVLQAMGASSMSIAAIFGFCGMIMGILSSLIGVGAALFTLHHIDKVVSFLSFLQGHDAFNSVFYGKTLPNSLSHDALVFVLIATPLLSLAAGLVPALKACRLRPSAILRSE